MGKRNDVILHVKLRRRSTEGNMVSWTSLKFKIPAPENNTVERIERQDKAWEKIPTKHESYKELYPNYAKDT